MVIDLRQIRYISSAGFRPLLIAAKMMEEANGKLVLCGMSAEIRRLFEIGEFTDLFTICGTRDEGIEKTKIRNEAIRGGRAGKPPAGSDAPEQPDLQRR